MRLAFIINPLRTSGQPTAGTQIASLDVVEISSEMVPTEKVVLSWSRPNDKADWKFHAFSVQGDTALHLLAAKRVLNETYKCFEEGEANIHDPLSFISVVENWDNGKQAVYDERVGKYRLAHLLKDNGNLYEANGTGITVEAEDEKSAIRKLQSAVTDAMVERPTKAAEYAEWFAQGRKVKELKNGKGPVALDRAILAKAGSAKK